MRGLIRLREADSALAAIERDSITGLYNKEAFLHYAKAFRAAHQDKELVAVMAEMADFEYLEDRYSPQAVKALLRHAGQLLLSPGELSIPGYLGEGRFVSLNISAPQLDSRWLASVTEESIRNSPIPGVRVKYGVYDKIPPQRDLAHIYRSIAGKLRTIRDSFDENLVVFGAEEERLILRRHQLASDMESSLANGDFHVVYQPKHYASSGKLCGAEALVRWTHPTLGPVSPGEFIPLFEENGLINQLDSFVHIRVYRTMRAWLESGLPAVPDEVPAHMLRAELTESMLTENFQQLSENMRRLNEVGYAIELDDFGAGYSNLAALAELPLDTIKLDMSLVRTLDTKEPVVRHCIELAHDLGLCVVAEGVETQEQLDKLRALGCDKVQGYYFSRPLPADEFIAYLKDHAARGMIA